MKIFNHFVYQRNGWIWPGLCRAEINIDFFLFQARRSGCCFRQDLILSVLLLLVQHSQSTILGRSSEDSLPKPFLIKLLLHLFCLKILRTGSGDQWRRWLLTLSFMHLWILGHTAVLIPSSSSLYRFGLSSSMISRIKIDGTYSAKRTLAICTASPNSL